MQIQKLNNIQASTPLQSFTQRISRIQKNYPNIAYVYAIIGNSCLVIMQLNLKIVCKYINPIHALAIRGFFLLVVNTIIIHYSGFQIGVRSPSTYRILVKRILFSGVTIILYLSPLAYIPSSTVNSLFNTGPIIVCFIEAYVYKKSLNKVHLLLTLICFIGIIIVVKPEFLFKNSSSQYQAQKIFMLFSLIAAFTNSFSMIFLHQLKGKVNSTIALEYFYISQALVNSFVMNFQHFDISQTNFDIQFFLCLSGLIIFAFFTQNFVTKAMMKKKPSYMMPFGYITIVGSALADYLIFNTSFDILTIIGMLLTSCGLLVKLIVPQQKQQKQNQQSPLLESATKQIHQKK